MVSMGIELIDNLLGGNSYAVVNEGRRRVALQTSKCD